MNTAHCKLKSTSLTISPIYLSVVNLHINTPFTLINIK